MEALIAWFAEIHWVAVLQIILIDILLGGDNAVVIALACRNLDPSLRFKGVLYGAAGAILLRVILIAFAVTIMNIPFLKLVGALLLLWIGIKHIVPQDEGEHEIHASKRLWGAIKTIIVADLVMSLDNVIAIAGAAEQAPAGHQMGLVIFGLLVSVPFILGGSQLFLKFIDRYPIIVYAGGALLGWIAGTLIVGDPGLTPHIPNLAEMHTPAGIAGAVFVLIVAFAIKGLRKKAN